MSHGDCPVCFDELTDANYRICCANEHELCETCFKEQVKPRGVECDYGVAGSQFIVEVSTNCPICRDPMLVWEEDLPEDQRPAQTQEQSGGEDFIVVDGIIVRGLVIERIRRGRRPAQTQELEDASERIRQTRMRETTRGRQLALDRALAMVNPVEQEIIATGNLNQPRPRRRRRRAQRCGNCRQTGHNRRSCPNQ